VVRLWGCDEVGEVRRGDGRYGEVLGGAGRCGEMLSSVVR